MNTRKLPSTAVDSYLKLIRMPLAGAISLLPGNGTGAQPTALLALDRVDAAVRVIAARLLGDPVLLEDAQQRLVAAEERERALRLRVEAERVDEYAEERLEQRDEQADRLRAEADERAEARRQQAAKERQEKQQHAKQVTDARLEANANAAEQAQEAVAKRAPRKRLDALEAKTEALRAKEQELAARDEARRLRQAATQAKAERKNG